METKHTPGPWEYVASNEHHGPYVAGPYGGDICDCYTMSNPSSLSVRNGGDSRPIHFKGAQADANARLIAEAPELLALVERMTRVLPKIDILSVGELASLVGGYRDETGTMVHYSIASWLEDARATMAKITSVATPASPSEAAT